jgi:hypothetical protein
VLLELLVKWVRGARAGLPELLVRRVQQDIGVLRDPQAMWGQSGQLGAQENKASEVQRGQQGRLVQLETRVLLGQKAIKEPLVMAALVALKATWDRQACQGRLATEVLLERSVVRGLQAPQVSRARLGKQASAPVAPKDLKALLDCCWCS